MLPDRNQNELGFEPEVEPWAQRVREKSKAYRAFLLFRDLGRGRSVLAAYRKWKGDGDPPRLAGAPIETDKDPTCVPPNWRRWSINYHWEDRARAWDAVQQREKEARERQVEEELSDNRRRQREVLDELRYRRILKMGEMIDNTLAAAQPATVGGVPTVLAKQRTEKDGLQGKQTSEVDLVRQLEVLCEQERELYTSYFGGLDENSAAAAAVVAAAEFTWVPDPQLESPTGESSGERSSIPPSPVNTSSTAAALDSKD